MSTWEGLSLEEKVGQLLMIGFMGTRPSSELVHLLRDRHVGGVILFFRNIEEAERLTELTQSIQELARRPLLLSADQEGGSVLRVRKGATLLPSAMGIGRLGEEAVRETGRICGEEMRALGLNLNLAPVLDINTPDNPGIGIRSFGERATDVARLGRAYVEGIQGAGVLACAKHFPGKGAAKLDAHLDLPTIQKSIQDLEAEELVPFRACIDAGVAATMTSHCVYRGIDEKPATLSRRMLTQLLRQELKFPGLLITDDMEMGAITRYLDGSQAGVASFAAGADIILVCKSHAVQEATLDAIIAAVKSGEIPMERLEESFTRIQQAKARFLPRDPRPISGLTAVNAPRIQEYCDRIVTVLRDPNKHLPLRGDSVDVYWPNMSVLTQVEEGSAGQEVLTSAFAHKFAHVRFVLYDPRNPEPDAETAARPVVFFSANAHLFPAQASYLQKIRKRSQPLVLVALRNPYDADLVGPSDTVVASYGFLVNTINALARTLLGGAS
jgi:beta-N-acetylhexosaminidase